ncbi:hypothetical protein BRADI_1g60318v3 [Brachypodium distachyon]|uniref:Uncharacterized protein n=1 Tax=Brachypodium distachyon TaxID=15368 RepID=A0A2K2DSL1_BRADI|nr:hypothetical protein BRADI_1g60318v3 [Brachypodium distachyon]
MSGMVMSEVLLENRRGNDEEVDNTVHSGEIARRWTTRATPLRWPQSGGSPMTTHRNTISKVLTLLILNLTAPSACRFCVAGDLVKRVERGRGCRSERRRRHRVF